MADTIQISPGVFTHEVDQTTLPEGVAGIGATIVGRTQKGPAFQPTTISNWNDFEAMFGTLDTNMYAPYSVKEYLKSLNSLNVVRVLGIHSEDFGAGNITYDASGRYVTEPAGFTASNGVAICHSSSVGWQVATIIHSNNAISATGTLQSVVVDFASGYNDGNPFTASYVKSDKNYVKKVLSCDSTQYVTASVGHYIWTNYEYNSSSIGVSTRFSGSALGYVGAGYPTMAAPLSFSQEYSSPATSWIYSQNFGANLTTDVKRYRLFKIIANDGEWANNNLKVTVRGIRNTLNEKATEYGYFDILIRGFSDTDKKQAIYEQFTNCTLDPNDTIGYIARKIGDKYKVWDPTIRKFIEQGDYDRKSKLVRVEIDDQVKNGMVPATSLPWSFYGYPKYASGSFPISASHYASVPNLPYVSNMKWRGDIDRRVCWGVAFNDTSGSVNYGIDDRMKVLPISASIEYDTLFSLDFISSSLGPTSGSDLVSDSNIGKLTYVHESGNLSASIIAGTDAAKFTLPFYGGFDGFNVHRANPVANNLFGAGGENSSTSAWYTTYYPWSYEVASFRRALDVIADPEEIDFNLLTIPGIYHPSVVNYAIQKIEDRADAFCIIDVSGSTTAEVKSWMEAAEFDSSYGAAYYPDVKIFDEVNNKDIWVPASVLAFGAYAYNDKVAYPWYAPAGFTRATLDAKDIREKLNKGNRDTLQSVNVNPIAKFPREGIVIWGQKTLQAKTSSLSSVNVRRMVLFVRKTVASAARYLVFEPNIIATWERFHKLVRPILDDVFRKYGIEDYKIVFDSTTNTPELINQLKMAGRIYIIPVRVGEIIDIGFILSPVGAQFTS